MLDVAARAEPRYQLVQGRCPELIFWRRLPERLGNSQFLERLLPLIQGSIGMFVTMLMLLTVIWNQVTPTAHAAAATSGDWPTYLFNNARSGFNAAETRITPKTAPNLKMHWSYKDPAAGIISVQPVEANSMIYWGSWNDGIEHAMNLAGHQVWGTSVGISPPRPPAA